MNKTLKLRKVGSQFIETVAAQGSHLAATRAYKDWEDVEKRLQEIGLPPAKIERLKSDFESGKDTMSIELP